MGVRMERTSDYKCSGLFSSFRAEAQGEGKEHSPVPPGHPSIETHSAATTSQKLASCLKLEDQGGSGVQSTQNSTAHFTQHPSTCHMMGRLT